MGDERGVEVEREEGGAAWRENGEEEGGVGRERGGKVRRGREGRDKRDLRAWARGGASERGREGEREATPGHTEPSPLCATLPLGHCAGL